MGAVTDVSCREAAALMAGFAERTGLTTDAPPRRYLWTDAFAVCNYLALACRTNDPHYKDLALRLVDQVHAVLGRHRPDDPRRGWLSGLSDPEGAAHPTRGGLRIGKALPERGPGDRFDARLEWDRDGQYFHYLTKWMHALDQVYRETKDPRFRLWARELAEAAHRAFVRGPAGARRMAWKMSTDLSRPVVPTSGQHDPLDGFLTCLQLETPVAGTPGGSGGPSLARALAEFACLLESTVLVTDDPLGLGGLLAVACRLAQIMQRGNFDGGILLDALLAAAKDGLADYASRDELLQPASQRLAFRELGLALGLSGLRLLRQRVEEDARRVLDRAALLARIQALGPHAALGPAITDFWRAPVHRRPGSWSDHRDINEVMLATSLLPEGFLVLSAAEG